MPVLSLTPAPSDTVTFLTFSPSHAAILLSSWSGALTLHSTSHGALTSRLALAAPILCSTLSATHAFAATLAGTVHAAAVTPSGLSPATVLPPHAAPASSLALLSETLLASASWDKTLHLHDLRAPSPATTTALSSKIYALTALPLGVAAATSSKQIIILDSRAPSKPLRTITPTLDAQLRCLSAPPDGATVVVGTSDGRVGVEAVGGGAPGFGFKCHRLAGRAYPVNGVAHTAFGSFATAGGDGVVNVWDGHAKKRLWQSAREETGVSAVAFDAASRRIAVAVGYGYEEGERDAVGEKVFIRNVGDAEILPRDGGKGE